MKIYHKDKAVEFVAGKKYSLMDFILVNDIIDGNIEKSKDPDQYVGRFVDSNKKAALFVFKEMDDEDWNNLVQDLKTWSDIKRQLVEGGVLK